MGEVVDSKPKPFKHGMHANATIDHDLRMALGSGNTTSISSSDTQTLVLQKNKARQYIHKHFPMAKTEDDDDNTMLIQLIYTPEEYEIG